MTPQEVIEHYGNGSAQRTAEKLGLTRQTIHVWVRADFVPLEWQRWIEEDTAGRYKADRRRPNDPHLRKNKVTTTSAPT
jgi:hypothetical protein